MKLHKNIKPAKLLNAELNTVNKRKKKEKSAKKRETETNFGKLRK